MQALGPFLGRSDDFPQVGQEAGSRSTRDPFAPGWSPMSASVGAGVGPSLTSPERQPGRVALACHGDRRNAPPAQRATHTVFSLTATPAELGSWPHASRATATPIGGWHGMAQEWAPPMAGSGVSLANGCALAHPGFMQSAAWRTPENLLRAGECPCIHQHISKRCRPDGSSFRPALGSKGTAWRPETHTWPCCGPT